MEAFVAYTAYLCERHESDLETVLSAYVDDVQETVSASESAGYVEDGQVTRDGVLAAVAFAERAGLAARTLPEQAREFRVVVDAVDEAAERGSGITDPMLPEGFDEYESDRERFTTGGHAYVNNRAKTYPDGSRVEVDYRSRDPSGPFEMKPDRASAAARLHDLGRTFSYSREWEEKY